MNARAHDVRPLRRTMFNATVLVVLYGLSLPALVLWRLLPAAHALESETDATNRAFASLRGQTAILQHAAALSRMLSERQVSASDVDSLANAVLEIRQAPRVEYSEIAEEMRSSFAGSIQLTDLFTASVDEAVRAARLGDDPVFRNRIERALKRVPDITAALDEAQRLGLADLLTRQQRMQRAGTELIYWTFAWLALGGMLVWYLVGLARQRLLAPLTALEVGLTELSNGNLDARMPDSGDELGRLANVFNHASDVLRRRAEEQGRFAAAGQLLADVAHEVNNPLMAIQGTAEARLSDMMLDPALRHDMQLVRDQAHRASKLLSGLLRFVRAGDERQEVVELSTVATSAIDLLAYQFPLHGIECRTDFAADTLPVRTAAIRLEQVLVNLLTNAVHAMLGTERPRTLTVRIWQEGSFSRVTVRDTGAGIAGEIRDRMFRPFATTKGDGATGLGLYICRRIAREAGGDLTCDVIDEQSGRGAQFTLSLPSSATPRVSVALPTPVSTQTEGVLAGLNILVVDDEDGVRTAIARYLRRSGANVREAAHGLDALTLVKAQQPDVVLLDLRMPVMDGYTFIATVRESNPSLVQKVLVLSGDLAAGSEANTPVPANRMLAKPVALGELARRLHEVATAHAA